MERNSNCWYEKVCDNECTSTCIRFTEMQYLMQMSNIPKSKQRPQLLDAPDCDLSAFRQLASIKSNIVDFVESGRNLYIASNYTGNGKTTWAIKLMLKYFDEVWAGNGMRPRGLFIHIPTFLLKCKDFNNKDSEFEAIKNLLTDVDLVIWDDIASTDISSYDYSQLLMYIDQRLLNDKANIYTGNFADRENLNKRVGAKLTSRIWADNTDIVIFKGSDKR